MDELTKSEELELQARGRVANDKRLDLHKRVIFADWKEWDEHMQWIATAPTVEILDWAIEVERDEEDDE